MRPMVPADTSDGAARTPRRASAPALAHHDVVRLVAIAVFAIATLLAVTGDWDSPIRVALTIAFLLFGPGLALAELLEIDDPVRRLALATGASLALETLIATALLYAEVFSAAAVCGIIVGLTCLALLGAAWRRGLGAGGPAADDARGAPT